MKQSISASGIDASRSTTAVGVTAAEHPPSRNKPVSTSSPSIAPQPPKKES